MDPMIRGAAAIALADPKQPKALLRSQYSGFITRTMMNTTTKTTRRIVPDPGGIQSASAVTTTAEIAAMRDVDTQGHELRLPVESFIGAFVTCYASGWGA